MARLSARVVSTRSLMMHGWIIAFIKNLVQIMRMVFGMVNTSIPIILSPTIGSL